MEQQKYFKIKEKLKLFFYKFMVNSAVFYMLCINFLSQKKPKRKTKTQKLNMKTFASLYHLNTFLFLFFTKTNDFFLIKMILFICLVVDFLIFFRKSIKKYFHKKIKKKLNS